MVEADGSDPVRPPTRRSSRRSVKGRREARTGLLLMSPTLLILIAVVIFPLLWSILISFQQLRLIQIGTADPFSAVSLDNFRLVARNGELWESLKTSAIYTVGSVVACVGVGLVAALAVRKPFRGRTLVRAAFLLPYVAPVVAVTYVWRIMLNPEFGIVNEFGKGVLGWDGGVPFLSQSQGEIGVLGLEIPVPTALLTVIAFEAWRYFPFAFLFLMARLEGLSAEMEEAATVDGATPLQVFRHIVLPQVAPILSVLVILRTIWTFNDFDDIFLLTGGTAGTDVASVRIYELLTVQRNVGGAAAQSLVLAAVLMVMLGIYVIVQRRRGERL